MSSSESGFLDSSFSRTRSLIQTNSFLRPRSVLKHRRSIQLFSQKKTEPPPRPRRPSQTEGGRSTMLNSSSPMKSKRKSSKSSNKSKASKKSGTILRAVAPATLIATAPLSPLERDMATLPNQEILSNIGISQGPESLSFYHPVPQTTLSRTRTRSSSATALSPIKAGTEMKFFSSSAELNETIGHYKRGRIEWEHKDPSERLSRHSTKNGRPRIQVIIPNEKFNRPLPSTPFFSPSNNNSHIVSAAAELAYGSDVSPPSVSSASKKIRDSMVSPLSAQQQQRAPRQYHSSITSKVSKAPSSSSNHSHNASASNSSSEDSHGDDASSVYSKRSSLTSVEGSPPLQAKTFSEKRTSFGIKSPVAAGIFDDEVHATQRSVVVFRAETGPQVQPPTNSAPRQYSHHPPIEEDDFFVRTCAIRPARTTPQITVTRESSTTLPSRRPTTRKSSRGSRRTSLAANSNMGILNQAVYRTESKQLRVRAASPTLSEAENDLEQELTSFESDNPFKWDDVVPSKDSDEQDTPDSAAPPLPRKSSKRMSQFIGSNFRLSRVPGDHIASQFKRNRSTLKNKGLKLNIPGAPKRMTDDFYLSPIPIPAKATKRSITPAVAENVILTILQNLESLDDLLATAAVNQGFYRVFKRHELELMKASLRKMSPPAWEHREICYPGHDQSEEEDRPRQEYTPISYLQNYRHDKKIITAIKSQIKEKCQSFMRPELAAALDSDEEIQTANVDDALWRIWTFCKIFGSGKGREEDIVAQMDWLKGGELVHQKTCSHSIFFTESIDMNDTLASAPECFAKGNEGGLTAEQLFDMMELWNCLGVLLQPFEGRTIQAREYGIYENTEVRGGDIDGEEIMLDEWYYYLLTLGLSPILDLAAPCREADASAFMLASKNGWANWKAPMLGGTRRNFLKEAASRVYEDKIAIQYAQSSTKEVQRQLSKQRIQRHITELRKRKNSGERLQQIRMSQERPMSEWEGVMNNLTRPRPAPGSNIVSHIPQLRSAAPNSVLPASAELPAPVPSSPRAPRSPLRRIVAQPLLPTPPPSTVPSVADWDTRSISAPSMPSIEEHPAFRKTGVPSMPSLAEHPAFARHMQSMQMPTAPAPPRSAHSNGSTHSLEDPVFQQHPRQREILSSNAADNTADKAVYRIVEMGFTPEQARHALRVTDLGDGLRVDRAVELLLRGDL
ncbi:hypothetical protein BDV96DRAFT_572993 [Lophiotrema nucula]|uniref:UBA domain-containing protein n=1 Tax=Lophiotrema nucula TaxID=690887 RepID=A0A6A5ZCD2_9PLEO|nr:hypothetical protein BDV96DRAFT_572993 [Lophiotrema nucula]